MIAIRTNLKQFSGIKILFVKFCLKTSCSSINNNVERVLCACISLVKLKKKYFPIMCQYERFIYNVSMKYKPTCIKSY